VSAADRESWLKIAEAYLALIRGPEKADKSD
jgi:hypothetical protein